VKAATTLHLTLEEQMTTRHSLLALTFLLLVGSAGCSTGSGDVTGPPPPPPAPPGPAPDLIQQVTVRFDSITVLGTCDYDSIFESSADGEFTFGISIRGIAVIPGWNATYREGTHALGSSAQATFARNVTKGERFTVVFTASEKDGALGNDSKLNNKSGEKEFQWVAGAWSGAAGASIQLQGPDPDLCGVRLRYTITSVRAS
jgi:hypothetical protein